MTNKLLKNFGLPFLLVLLGACGSDTQASEADSNPPKPDQNNQTSPSYRLELAGAEDEAMCRALDAAIQKRWKPGDWGLCSIPVTEAGPEFSMPQWRKTDGLALIDEIRELALLKDWKGSLKPVTEKLERQRRPRKAPDEIIKQVWKPIEQDFVALLRSGDIEVQEAQFDFDNNGEIDTIYRIRGWTLKETGKTDKPYAPEFWEPKTCSPGNIDVGVLYFKKRTHDYGYHDLADLLNSYAARRKGENTYYLFFHEGKTYQHWSYLKAISTIPNNPQGDYCDWRRIEE